MTRHQLGLLIIGLSLFLLVQGCGPGNPLGRKAISGAVTLDGAPIESGSIDFQPLQAGGVSSGSVISNGNYTIAENQGLPVGKYQVSVFASNPNPPQLPPGGMPGDDAPEGPPPKQTVPPEWNEKGDQNIEVKEQGPFKFNFDITTKKK